VAFILHHWFNMVRVLMPPPYGWTRLDYVSSGLFLWASICVTYAPIWAWNHCSAWFFPGRTFRPAGYRRSGFGRHSGRGGGVSSSMHHCRCIYIGRGVYSATAERVHTHRCALPCTLPPLPRCACPTLPSATPLAWFLPHFVVALPAAPCPLPRWSSAVTRFLRSFSRYSAITVRV